MAPSLRVTGALFCAAEEGAKERATLADHIRLTRAEPGHPSFDIRPPAADTGRGDLDEEVADRAVFAAYRACTRDPWRVTAPMPRAVRVRE